MAKDNIQTIQTALLSIFPQVLVLNSDTELTEAEIQEALDAARVKKQIRVEAEIKANRRRLMEQEALRGWDAKEQYLKAMTVGTSILRSREQDVEKGKKIKYELDEHLKEAFRLLCLYFTNDKRFEEKGYSLSKGIMLSGNVGVGKTLLMHCFSRNKRQCFDVISAISIADGYKEVAMSKTEDAVESLYKYFAPQKTLIGTFEFFMQKQIGLCIDDVGEEESPIKTFGNEMNVIERILSKRYANKVEGQFTHITTNLDGSGIEKKYGARIRSRMRELFNEIEISGNDRRK